MEELKKKKRKKINNKSRDRNRKFGFGMIFMIIISVLSLGIISGVNLILSAIEYHDIITLASTYEHKSEAVSENVYKNVFITANDTNRVEFYYDGQAYSFDTVSKIEEDLEGEIADIYVSGEVITEIYVKSSVINGKLLSSNDEEIEVENYEKLMFDDDLEIYYLYNGIIETKANFEWIALFDEVSIIVENEKVQAVITSNDVELLIDVLITTTGFKSNYHDSVTFVSDGSFEVIFSDGSYYAESNENMNIYSDASSTKSDSDGSLSFSKATITLDVFRDKYNSNLKDYVEEADEEKDNDENYIIVRPVEGKIGISSILRNGEVPYYRGNFIIRFSEKGLLVINNLPLEEYLYGVVPSEMPAYYNEEAIKAQSICARSFACVQMNGSYFRKYGADVDDSTNCQVYNNQEESEIINDCVNATAGQVVSYEGEILKTYYYSTSCGSSALPSDVWGGQHVSGYRNGLLVKVTQLESGVDNSSTEAISGNEDLSDYIYSDNMIQINLSEEDAFANFIKNGRISYKLADATVTEMFLSYEDDLNWYRWSAQISKSKLEEIVKSNLSEVISAYSDKISAFANGNQINISSAELGSLEKIMVTGRAESGIVTELTISGSLCTYIIKYQSAIRQLLSYSDLQITVADGTTKSNLNILPSAFFTIEYEDGIYKIYGGGYGHGVGMSQDGAGAMAEEGMTYMEIIDTYFEGSTVKMIKD